MRDSECYRMRWRQDGRDCAVENYIDTVVNGDTEMLHVLRFDSGQCKVHQSRSLQNHVIREEVCSVMEGRRKAFERRYRRLGPDSANV